MPLNVVYLGGPGDAPDVLRRRAAGERFDAVAHDTYSGQVFDVCRELDANLLSLSYHKRTDDFTHGKARAINRPNRLTGGGLEYHFGNVAYAWEITRDALRFRADVVITATEPHPFLLEPLIQMGVKVVPALHATILPEFRPSSRAARMAMQLSRHFYGSACTAILSHPGACVRQVVELTNGRPRPIVEFLPLYRPDYATGIAPPRRDGGPFRVITVGRLEASKGVFDLIAAAKKIRAAGRNDVHFDVCGNGSALEDARRTVREAGLEDRFVLHGWTEIGLLRELWGKSHVAVVPTTTDFTEGFNQVVIEALLAGRPVITSRVCPALDYARPSSIEVRENDAGAYADAILKLADDRVLYDRLQGNCATLVSVFLDPTKSFGAGVRRVLQAIESGREVEPVTCPPATVPDFRAAS
jgi:glycosyltransferase involved in cell wall biosynthesis